MAETLPLLLIPPHFPLYLGYACYLKKIGLMVSVLVTKFNDNNLLKKRMGESFSR
jgi:hypothetical protein